MVYSKNTDFLWIFMNKSIYFFRSRGAPGLLWEYRELFRSEKWRVLDGFRGWKWKLSQTRDKITIPRGVKDPSKKPPKMMSGWFWTFWTFFQPLVFLTLPAPWFFFLDDEGRLVLGSCRFRIDVFPWLLLVSCIFCIDALRGFLLVSFNYTQLTMPTNHYV